MSKPELPYEPIPVKSQGAYSGDDPLPDFVPDSEQNHQLPSSEDLDTISKEQRIAETTVTNVNGSDPPINPVADTKCVICGSVAERICTQCGQDFCPKHFCPVHELATQSEPLIEEDGTTHQGRRIRLIGEGWPNSLRMIKDYSDEELDSQIGGLQKLLQDAIKTADYARISISAREYERDYRQHSRYVKAMKRREKIEQGAVRLNSKSHRVATTAKPLSMAETFAKQMNISIEQAIVVLAALGVQKKI